MTDEHGNPLPEYKHISHDKNYIHFHEIYNDMPDKKDIYYAQSYRYSHTYDSEHMTPTQQVIVKHDGILLIRELPDTCLLYTSISAGENFRFDKNGLHSVTADERFKMGLLLVLE